MMAPKRIAKCSVCNEAKSKLTLIDGDLYCPQCMEEMIEEDITSQHQPEYDDMDIKDEIVSNDTQLADDLGQPIELDDSTVMIKQEPEEFDEMTIDHPEGLGPFNGSDNQDLQRAIEIKEEITIEETKVNIDEHDSKRLKLICKYCGLQCESNPKYRAHLRQSHPEEKKVICRICFFVGTGDLLYRKHIQEEHDGFECMCKICHELYHPKDSKRHQKECEGRLLFQCKSCKEYYGKKEALWKHLDKHDISENSKESSFTQCRIKLQLYSCKICEDDKLYKHASYWKHIKSAHQGYHLRCKYCPKTFRTPSARTIHTCVDVKPDPTAECLDQKEKSSQKRPPAKEFKCPECPKVYKHGFQRNEHVRTTHRITPRKCDICELEFRSKSSLKYHKLRVHTEAKFECPTCEKKFYFPKSYRDHLKTHDKKENEPEDQMMSESNDGIIPEPEPEKDEVKIQEKIVSEITQLLDDKSKTATKHKEKESEETKMRKLRCTYCGVQFLTNPEFRAHLKKSHPEEKKVVCTICYFVGKGVKLYQQHIQEEHDGFECMCKICLELYHLGDYDDHKTECAGRLVFQCNSCQECYGNKEALWKHLDGHDIPAKSKTSSFTERRIMEQFYSCKLCEDDRLYTNDSYWEHIKIAHQGHHLRCRDCPKTFKSRASKSNHVCNEKSSVKEFKCPECPKAYNKGFKLNEHIRTTHRLSPVTCEICGIECKTKRFYRYHKARVHTEPKYKCPVCSRKFRFPSNYQAHLLKHQKVKKAQAKHHKDTQLVGDSGESSSVQTAEELTSHTDQFGSDVGKDTESNITYEEAIESDENTDQEELQMKSQEQDINSEIASKIRCSYCGFQCVTNLEHRAHIRVNHSEDRRVACSICFIYCKGETRYREHLQENHDGFECLCKFCLGLYHLGDYNKHRTQCLGRLLFQCRMCKEYYGKKDSLWKHLDEHGILEGSKNSSFTECRINKQFYNCTICEDDRAYEKDLYWIHVKNAHEGNHLRCRYCPKTFKALGARSRHTSIECKGNPWSKASSRIKEEIKCHACPKVYKTVERLKEHLWTVHKTHTLVKCDICEAEFKTRGLLKHHKSTIHSTREYECIFCQRKFVSSDRYQHHLERHQYEKNARANLPQDEEADKISSQSELEDDESEVLAFNDAQTDFDDDSSNRIEVNVNTEQINDPIIEYGNQCDNDVDMVPEDGTSNDNTAILVKDEITIEEATVNLRDEQTMRDNDELKLTCKHCAIDFSTKSEYKTHLKKNHPENKMLECSICLFTCKGDTLLRKHIQEKHDVFECKCNICLEQYHARNQEVHKQQCLGRLLFQCKPCEEYYDKKEALWKHLDEHKISADSKESSFTECRIKQQFYNCAICEDDKAYEEDRYLVHVEDAHKGHRFRCKNCPKTFTTKMGQLRHTKACCKTYSTQMQMDKQGIKCPECHKPCRNKASLQAHVRNSHEPATCDECKVEFKSKSIYTYHRVTVHQTPKFQCPYCLKKFHLAAFCRTHMIVHKNEEEVREMIRINK